MNRTISNKGQTVGFLLRLAILFTALPDTGAGSAIPVLHLMMEDMPEVNASLVQMTFTIPTLCLIVFPPLYDKITAVVSRKNLLIIAFVLFLIGTLGPIYTDNIYGILFFRFLLGVSSGVYNPITVDLAVSYFEGDAQRRMLGLCFCFTCIGGVLYQTVGGILGQSNWHNAFWANLIAVPFFLFAIVFLPEKQALRPEHGGLDGAREARRKSRLTAREWALLTFGGFNEMCLYVLLTCGSTYIISGGYGNAAAAGLVSSLFTVGGLLIAPFFGSLFRVFKRYMLMVSCLILGTGLFFYVIGDSLLMCLLGAVVCGLGQGLYIPCTQNLLAVIAPPERKGSAVVLTFTARGIGGFVCPYVFAVCYRLTGVTIGRASFLYGTIGVLVMLVVMLAFHRRLIPGNEDLEVRESRAPGK